MEVFLFYMYKDELDSRLDAELAAAVLHIEQYYGAPRLAGLCERRLAREIKNGDAEDEGAPGSIGSALHAHWPASPCRQVSPGKSSRVAVV